MPYESLVFTNPITETLDLSTVIGSQYLQGIDGRFGPPTTLLADQVPLKDGSRYRGQQAQDRTVNVAMTLVAASRSAMRNTIRNMSGILMTTDPDVLGQLALTTEDARQFLLYCNYVGGLETLDMNQKPSLQKMVLSFRAPDPAWYDFSDTQLTYTLNASAKTFFPFFFPWSLTSSTIFNSATITNSGDLEAYPVWTITGPGNDIILRNLSTGQVINLTGYSLAAGQVITIDTRPGMSTITRDDGSNLYRYMTAAGRSLWRLQPGTNNIQLEMSAASAASSVVINYRRRWYGA